MNNYASEINLVMNYFALVDQCQNLAGKGYSITFTMEAMSLIERRIKGKLQRGASDLFNELEKIYFPSRSES